MERTEVNISTSFSELEVKDEFLFLGSCFSDNIGGVFSAHKLKTIVNPFGVIFHPMALSRLIQRALNQKLFVTNDFFQFNDYWFCYELSGSCAQFTLEEAVSYANHQLELLKAKLIRADHLFLTFGSSVSRSINSFITANCHKQPSNKFKRSITSSTEIQQEYVYLIDKLGQLNPNLKIHLTVSPVRHSKEGLVDNNRSKANLLIASQELEEKFQNVEYLPIYELVIDELRDYNFFKEDLVHPNDKTIKIVWDRLIKGLGSKNLQSYLNEVSKLKKDINHKSLYPKSENNISFLKQITQRIQGHQLKYNTSWEPELTDVKNRLKNMA